MNELFDIAGKVALVTGGSRGIGEMIAEGYVARGVKTYISSRKADACSATAERLSLHGECIAIPANLSSLEGVHHLANAIKAREPQLDILVNNAGATWGASIEEFPESGWDKVMDINVKGPFFLTRLCCRCSKNQRHQRIPPASSWWARSMALASTAYRHFRTAPARRRCII